jgi:hypothetical protein
MMTWSALHQQSEAAAAQAELSMSKPILCLDFDGVLHSYSSGWVAAHFIPDPPVPGALEFLYNAIEHFDIVIFSARSSEDSGILAMRTWLEYWARRELGNDDERYRANAVINAICTNPKAWPTRTKPPAFLTIDDRALTFDGTWPAIAALKAFKPWNKQ